ncbi:MAG: hypothetical protein RL572_1839 [Pseudomonadota bacterium]|jgi:uncharacterized membrane protein
MQNLESPTAESQPPRLIEESHRAVVYSYGSLLAVFVLYSLWQIINGGNAVAVLVLLIIKTLPLVIFIPGLRVRRLRTYAWLSFVSLLYFIQSVQTAFTQDARLYGIVCTLIIATLFCALVVHIRSYRGFYKVSF